MTVGRKPKYDVRMKPNGLPAELDAWLSNYAKTLGKTGAELKREVLSGFRQRVEEEANAPKGGYLNQHGMPIEFPNTLVGGE